MPGTNAAPLLKDHIKEEYEKIHDATVNDATANKDARSAPVGGCPLMDFNVPTAYAKHPGGQHLLEMARRSDVAGLLFLSYHMGTKMNSKVALAAKALGVTLPERGAMFNEIHEAVLKVIEAHPRQGWCWMIYCLLLTFLLPFMALWWMAQPSICSCLGVAIPFELYFLNVFHTRHHKGGRLYQNRILHEWTLPMYEFMDATWGYYPAAWRYNHHVKHHVFTNDADTDTDVPALHPYVRACYEQPRLWFHRFQTLYWPFLVPFSAIQFPVNNIMVHNGKGSHFCVWFSIMFIYPLMAHGWNGIYYSLLSQFIAGGSLAYKFAVSHAHQDLKTTTTSEESYKDIDSWLVAQAEESMSYGGFVTTFLLGGINMQIEHHMCPALDPPLYYFISPEIARICRKYGARYTKEPSFFHAVWRFHQKLWQMGLPDK